MESGWLYEIIGLQTHLLTEPFELRAAAVKPQLDDEGRYFMSEQLIFTAVGALLGFLLSVLFWWYWNHRIVPIILFSTSISKKEIFHARKRFSYRIKFKNAGKRRAIDVSVICRIGIYELAAKKIWNWYVVEASAKEIPELSAGKGNRVITLWPERTDSFGQAPFPPDIVRKHSSATLTIEDVLELGTAAELRVYIFAYDEFSGARKLYTSPTYTRSSLKEGIFCGLDVVAPSSEHLKYSETEDDADTSESGSLT